MNALALRGYTLVEVVIVIGIFTFLLLGLALLFMVGYRTFQFEQLAAGASHEARVIVQEVGGAVRVAHEVAASVVIEGATYTTDADTLALALPAVDASQNVITGAYDYIVFDKTGAEVYERVLAHASSVRESGTKRLGSSVSELEFIFDNPSPSLARVVDVTAVASAAYQQASTTRSIYGRAYLRN